MLTANEVAERLKIKKGSAYEVIRQMNKEQEALGRVVIRGRVRSDLFEARYFPEVDEAQVLTQDGMPCGVLAVVSLLREKYGRPVAAYAA